MSNYSSRTKSLGELVDSLIVNSNNLTLLIVLKMLYGGLIRGLPDTCKNRKFDLSIFRIIGSRYNTLLHLFLQQMLKSVRCGG